MRLGDVLATVSRQAQRMANGVTLHPAPPDALTGVTVNGDADYLEQLILILLDNAFKYTPPPGGVRLDAEHTPNGVRISVTDTGWGVPEEDAERIFERFSAAATPPRPPAPACPSPAGSPPSTAGTST